MKATESQVKILTGSTVRGFENSELFPLYGSGQVRSGYALERKGFGKVVSSSTQRYHSANRFFKFVDGYSYNWINHEITAV